MKRVFAVLASASFVLAIGCSDYDIRLGKTLEEKRYEKSLNTYLEDAPTKGASRTTISSSALPRGIRPSSGFRPDRRRTREV